MSAIREAVVSLERKSKLVVRLKSLVGILTSFRTNLHPPDFLRMSPGCTIELSARSQSFSADS